MKKAISLVTACLLLAALLAGCGAAGSSSSAAAGSSAPESGSASEPASEPAAETGVKFGLGLVTELDGTDAAADKDGKGEADVTAAAVLVDGEGKVLSCYIDVMQTSVGIAADGTAVVAEDADLRSKQEKGADYGMVGASGIGKEWYEQAEAFAAWAVGKTADEIAAGMGEDGKAADADLAAGCTVGISGFVEAMDKAIANAEACDAAETDTVRLGMAASLSGTDATADAEGKTEADVTVSAVALNAEGVVTASALDVVQAKVSFDAAGAVTSDLAAAPATKQELGADYGMAGASGIGKEWYEQADAFAAWTVGKTADQIATGVGEDGKAADADLAAGCTVGVTDFVAAAVIAATLA